MIPRVLCIAGSDSGGGAGIQADVKAVTMLGGHAMTAVTAITAQNTVGVDRIAALPADLVVAQVDAVAADIGVDAIKIGMLGSAAVAEAVATRLGAPDLARVPVVFDPVMVATTGAVLADTGTAAAFRGLLARAALVTPNLDELAALAGRPVPDAAAIAAAAAALLTEGRTAALLATGVAGPAGTIADWLFQVEAGVVRRTGWEASRIDTVGDHGTGCTLSSAIACGLGAGLTLADAIARARAYVRAALAAAPGLGRGRGPMGHALGRTPFDDQPPPAARAGKGRSDAEPR